jgi:hypothetical protein
VTDANVAVNLEELKKRHRPADGIGQTPCLFDGHGWPCDSRRLLDEVEALRSALGLIESRSARYIEASADALEVDPNAPPASSVVYHARDTARRALNPEEVMTQTANEPST